jgi:hypothetical protein
MSATTSPFPTAPDERITAEGFQSDRLVRRLELLEQSIADGERALRGSTDPVSGRVVPPARGGYREQILSNLSVERALADTIRRSLESRG